MSVRSWGGFILDECISDIEKIDFSFQVDKIALENRIGIKLGWNVWPDFRREYKDQNNVLPFELIDNPMTNVAEVLFVGDGVILKEMGKRVDMGESLDSRMNKVFNFLYSVINIKIVKKIALHINSGFGEEKLVETHINDFKDKIFGLYKMENSETPTVRFVLNR